MRSTLSRLRHRPERSTLIGLSRGVKGGAFTLMVALNVLPVAAQSPNAEAPTAEASRDGYQNDKDLRARSLFREGKAAYTGGDFRLAWERFREAYLLSQRPALLYNVGQAADRMGQTSEALTAFQMYLDALPNAANAEAVRGRIAVLDAEAAAADETGNALPAEEETNTEPSHRRDWMVRGALGLGLYFASFQDSGGLGGSVRGLGLALDTSAAYAVLPNLLVGGLLSLNYQPAPTIVQGDGPSESMGSQLVWGLGPQATYFLDPESHGGTVNAGLLLMGADAARRGTAIGSSAAVSSAIGAGLVVGGGYEVPFTGELSYGIGGRLTLATLSQDEISFVAFALTAMATATWY